DQEYGTNFSVNGNAKIEYATKLHTYGRTLGSEFPKRAQKKIYGVMLSKFAYNSGLALEDLRAVAEHEVRHVNQFTQMRQIDSDWEILDKNFVKEDQTYFMEANAFVTNLNSKECWLNSRYNTLLFRDYNYATAYVIYTTKNEETSFKNRKYHRNKETEKLLKAMRNILQTTYWEIPFIEMKNKNYNDYLQPPAPIQP
ncbi:MAG: hypothetical protein LBC74_15545, partial [Planctomycetaceae bacterium]|nr:hypothetical protein [Planctomycetaceae bacterium]